MGRFIKSIVLQLQVWLQYQNSHLPMIQVMSYPSHPLLHYPPNCQLSPQQPWQYLRMHQNRQCENQQSKKKVELCKSFMDYGVCPYENRCKFAHGYHDLMKNHEMNNKYKTKECQNFVKHHSCMYGRRCNFIHRHQKYLDRSTDVDVEMRLTRKEGRQQSRLMGLLCVK